MPRWDPQREERGAAADRILSELRAAVRTELDRIERTARRAGPPARRKRTGLEHLVWLARYQFLHESYPLIAHDACRLRQTVAEGVRSAAELVGLPLRSPDPSGRPRKASGAASLRSPLVLRPAPVPVRLLMPALEEEYYPPSLADIDREEPVAR